MLYAVFLWATRAGVLDRAIMAAHACSLRSRSSRSLLMIGSFIYFAHFTGAPPGSTYVPAHIENGKFVPGQTRVSGARRANSMRPG